MSWLGRIRLDTDTIKKLHLFDPYEWHKKLWMCVPKQNDSNRDFLSRIDVYDEYTQAWLLSNREPICPNWCSPDAFMMKRVAPTFLSHKKYVFDLLANPVVKNLEKKSPDGNVVLHNGKPVLKRQTVHPDKLVEWIDRKASENGFSISNTKPLEVGPVVKTYFYKQGIRGCHGGVQFRGVLDVTDPVKFSEAYHKGIGAAKGFGFGMLLLSPVV